MIASSLAVRWPGSVAIAVVLAAAPGLAARGAASPTSPPSDVVLVTGGEHGTFSRVVFALGGERPYRTEPEAAGLRVVLPGAHVRFEYGAVYPARRAHRIIMAEPGIDPDGASLHLRFGCDCSARTFMLGDRLVVDVFDAASSGRQPAGSGAVAPAGEPDVSAASERIVGTAADRIVHRVAPEDLADAPDQGQPRPEFVRRVENLGGPAQDAGSDAAPGRADFNPDHLQRMLDWAIEQGHLTGLTEHRDRASVADHIEDAQEPAASAATLAPTKAPTAAGQPGPLPVAPRPAVADEPSVVKEDPPVASGVTGSCPDQGALDMAALGGDGTFAVELARRQDALSRALAAGQGLSAAQHALAGFYLARLMPHEALRLLRDADREARPTPTRMWLEMVARMLVDRASVAAARPLQAASCRDADVQLWQAVLRAADGPLPRQILERDAILQRLAAYPPDLRVELALRLAEAGVDAQAAEATDRLLDMVERAGPADEARARMLFLRGRLAAARGDFAGARASWGEALHLPGEGGLRATLALLEWEFEHDALDEAEALPVLEGLAYDWRGHPAQLDIARLTAAIHERHGRVSLALRAIEEVALGAEGRPSGRAAARLATDLMRRAYADAPSALPIDQLAAFWRYEGFVPPGAEGADVRFAFARALVAHGLPNAAIGLLEPHAREAHPMDEQIVDLLAEAYLAGNRPSQALDLLRAAAQEAPAYKPDRNLVAARALAALGRFAEAAGILHDDAGEQAARLQADYLWKAGLWQEATTAYRDLLHEQQQPDPESAVRLAAAAYMADEPALLQPTGDAAEGGDAGAMSAFARLPKPGGPAARAVAAQLLDQAASLTGLAERYGLGGKQLP